MKFEKKAARSMSRMGSRAVYGQAITYFAEKYGEKIFAVSADLGRSSGLSKFSIDKKEQFLNVGIAEQNMVGISAGLSRQNFTVFASSFAPFVSMRACEQVRMNMGYMQESVNLVALASGVALGFLGNSHYGLEDINVIRSIPNIRIICPADCFEIYKVIESCINHKEPTYIRLTGGVNNPITYEEDYIYKIGIANKICNGDEIAILTHGSITGVVKSVINNENLNYSLYNFHTLNPLDTKCIEKIYNKYSKIIIVEEHFEIGGLYSILLEYFNKTNKDTRKIQGHGLPFKYLKAGTYDYVMNEYGLNYDGIKNLLNKGKNNE